ncbi:unnamed protein product [Arctia plantaginis]|uniref:LRRCT domain-containing protein n=1 Tax=Arctia plantaginis TaxID=874455 RepID=A0A8S0ZL31_ARCPL|nr:unnamed protein product [Arctia plantaginis]
MFYYKVISLRVFLLVLLVSNLSFAQLEVLGITTTASQLTEALEVTDPPSEVICSVCACEDGVVDCANRNITSSFELTDWDGLARLNPITVDLSQNLLTTVTRISHLPIQSLNLSSCEIQKIEIATFTYLEDLRSLDLSRNKISTSNFNKMILCGPLEKLTGPSSFKQMQNLSLAHNDLHSLPQDLFVYMDTLSSLDLSGNPLAYIDQVTMGAISDLVNLKRLALSSCELETLPEGLLRRQKKLRWLDISDNRFTTIPSVLQEAPKLVFLSLDRNPIQTIKEKNLLSKLTSLKELQICRMSRLQNITAGALGGLTNLEILRLNYNPRLTNLSPDFLVWQDEDDEEQYPIIKELYLNNNNLTNIDSHILDSWNELVIGDFSNNPYVCDCNSQWMVDVLVPMLANFQEKSSENLMVCKKPAHLRGQTFVMLHNSSRTLVCNEVEDLKEHTPANLAIILGILIGVTCTFPLVLVLMLLWKKGYFAKYCSRKKTRKESYSGYDEGENENL